MSWHIYPAAAAAAVRRSVRPCRHGTKRVLFSRHLLHVGGTQVAHPTGGGPWTYSLPNEHVYKKKEIWVSLSRRAQIPHSTRTKVHGSAPLHHTTNLHSTTTCYSTLLTYYGDKDAVCFKSRMFCFLCSAVLLPETYGIPYHHHAPLQGGKTTPSSPAVSYIPYLTLLELAPRTIYMY